MHKIVKFITDEDGEKYDSNDWHLAINASGANQALCSGQVFGEGFSNVDFEFAEVKSGQISCKKCIELICKFKKIQI